ncbi:MAG: CoA ester lyase [Propionibacteriaceae bacterium]|jgi:citrate lyase subunit beta/citryl-CoA lyase|nr:CoA ester lyase [Propionibacteriaceae bacterium]
MPQPQPRRTVLAVPGSSDRFIAKSRGLAADAVFLDLEDAVAPAAKAEARSRIVGALTSGEGWRAGLVTVRVNDWSSPWTLGDLTEVVGRAGDRIDAIVLPKVTDPQMVAATDLVLTQLERENGWPVGAIGIEAQIEEPRGLLAVSAIAAASPRLASLVFGPGDFMAATGMGSLNVGAQPEGYPADAFHYPLMAILMAARAHGLQAVDGPFVAIRDLDGFVASARRSNALGYDGKWVLHPDQIEAGNAIFTPSGAVLERARRIVAAYDAALSQAGGAVGAIVVDEEMVDEAGAKLAAALLAKAGAVEADGMGQSTSEPQGTVSP